MRIKDKNISKLMKHPIKIKVNKNKSNLLKIKIKIDKNLFKKYLKIYRKLGEKDHLSNCIHFKMNKHATLGDIKYWLSEAYNFRISSIYFQLLYYNGNTFVKLSNNDEIKSPKLLNYTHNNKKFAAFKYIILYYPQLYNIVFEN